MRFPPAPTSLQGIRIRTSGIEPGGHRWVKNPTKALLGGGNALGAWQRLAVPVSPWKFVAQAVRRGFFFFFSSGLEFCGICLCGLGMSHHPGTFASVSEQGYWVVLDEFLLKCLSLKGWKGLEGWG